MAFVNIFDLFWTYSIWTKGIVSFHKAVQGCFFLDFNIALGFAPLQKTIERQ